MYPKLGKVFRAAIVIALLAVPAFAGPGDEISFALTAPRVISNPAAAEPQINPPNVQLACPAGYSPNNATITRNSATGALLYNICYNDAGTMILNISGGSGVASVTGTTNQITSTGGTTPIVALANPLSAPGTVTAPGFIGTNTTSTGQLSQTNPIGGCRYLASSQNADATKGPFVVSLDGSGMFGSTYDEVMAVGYNAACGGGQVLAGEPAGSWTTEQDYFCVVCGNKHVMEAYYQFITAGGVQNRPIFFQFDRSTGALLDWHVHGDVINFFNWETGTNYMRIDKDSGLSFSGDPTQANNYDISFQAQNGKSIQFSLSANSGATSFAISPLSGVTTNAPWCLAVAGFANCNAVIRGDGQWLFGSGGAHNGAYVFSEAASAAAANSGIADFQARKVTGQTWPLQFWDGDSGHHGATVDASEQFGQAENQVLYWTATVNANTSADMGLSRDSAGGGVVDIGTGAQGSKAGAWAATSGRLVPVLVSALPAAAAGNAGWIQMVSDSTTISAEGQTCAGSSSNTALAISNGSVWKCF